MSNKNWKPSKYQARVDALEICKQFVEGHWFPMVEHLPRGANCYHGHAVSLGEETYIVGKVADSDEVYVYKDDHPDIYLGATGPLAMLKMYEDIVRAEAAMVSFYAREREEILWAAVSREDEILKISD